MNGIAAQRLFDRLRDLSKWVRRETIRIHKRAQDTRVASSLSCVEILTVLYYGKTLRFDPKNPLWEGRDRLIISKGHGAISLYPILADLGFFDKKELENVCGEGSFLGGIPDPVIPGFETVNGSLGHGLGVGCGMALALKKKKRDEKVMVLVGDGELCEGSMWEAIMFAGEHRLDNLMVIIDCNKVSMLDFCKNIIDLEPLSAKLSAFKWSVETVDGHDVEALYASITEFKKGGSKGPKALIANTVKGKGVPALETDPLSHIKNLKAEEADAAIAGIE